MTQERFVAKDTDFGRPGPPDPYLEARFPPRPEPPKVVPIRRPEPK